MSRKSSNEEIRLRKAVGMRINTLLAENDMYQYELAEKIGVNRIALSRWIAGAVMVNAFYLMRISEVLEVSTDWLLKGGKR